MTRFFWDTNVFIYRWDSTSALFQPAKALHHRMIANGIELMSSTLAVGELQVGPRRSGDDRLAARYKSALAQMATVVPFDDAAADSYALVRQGTRVKGPDAIHLACAAAHGVELFVTNDDKLHGLRVPGIQFVVSIETALQLLP